MVRVPLRAYRDLPAKELTGKVVLSANNNDLARDGVFPELDGCRATAELEQEQLPGAQLVKDLQHDLLQFERSTPAWAAPYGSYENPTGTPAGRAVIEAAVAAATRG